jgi:hypothetical protein
MRKLAFVVSAVVACGGPSKGPEGPGGEGGGAGSAAKPMGPGDVAFDVQPQEIKGIVWEPEALGKPGMPMVDAKKKTTLDKQRQAYEKAKDPVLKQAHAAVLATMLYVKAKDAKGDDKTKLYQDARQVLRDVAAATGEKVDELTLRLLGSYELELEDFAAAEKAWGQLVAKAPKDKDVLTNKAWWGYSLLKQSKNADALAAVGSETVSEKHYELAYVIAWAKWRTGDKKGAWDALLVAAKGWGTNPGRDKVDNDIQLFAGRNELSPDETVTALTPIYGKSPDQQYGLLSKLGLQAYLLGGRWADGVAVLDKAMAAVGSKVPVNDRPTIRYTQADYTVRLDDPVTSAKFAKEAVDALPACGTKCSDKDKSTLVQYVYLLGRLFHVVYANTHDDRYYQPAHDLYALSVSKILDDKTRQEAQKEADTLEKTFKAMKAGVGTHEKGSIGALLGRRNLEVQSCYEYALGSNPKLAGTLVVNLESDQTGTIKGVSTEPAGGLQGMAAVASCVTEKAKKWKLPTRAQAGSTRIKASYSLGPSKK